MIALQLSSEIKEQEDKAAVILTFVHYGNNNYPMKVCNN